MCMPELHQQPQLVLPHLLVFTCTSGTPRACSSQQLIRPRVLHQRPSPSSSSSVDAEGERHHCTLLQLDQPHLRGQQGREWERVSPGMLCLGQMCTHSRQLMLSCLLTDCFPEGQSLAALKKRDLIQHVALLHYLFTQTLMYTLKP